MRPFSIGKKMQHETIVFIDDIPEAVEAFIHGARQHQFEVHFFGSGRQGLEFITKNPVNLVVLDLVMPEMDGVEVLQKIRLKFSRQDLPVIVCSTKTSELDSEMALVNGANLFINKNLKISEFLSCVQSQLRNANPLK